jgi:hypothetical protein
MPEPLSTTRAAASSSHILRNQENWLRKNRVESGNCVHTNDYLVLRN